MPKTKTARIKKFKQAFLKPKEPDKESLKIKTALEKGVALAMKKGSEDAGKKAITSESTKLKTNGKSDYLHELLAYKLTKHWDEPKEFRLWLDNCGDPQNQAAAAKKFLGDNPSLDLVKELWERCPDHRAVTQVCFELAPDQLVDAALDEFKKTGKTPDLANNDLSSRVGLAIGIDAGIDKIPMNIKNNISLVDAGTLAKHDPKAFAKAFFNELGPTFKLKFLKSPEVRQAMATDKELWKELSKEMPGLSFLDSVQKKVKDVLPSELKTKTADAVFEELLSDTGVLGMSYYTNSLIPPTAMLAEPREKAIAKIKDQKERLQKDIDQEMKEKKAGYEARVEDAKSKIATMPDVPGAQCDELVTVLMNVLEGAFGPTSDVKCKHIVLPGMVLTVPIGGLPGGLLENTFGGNVYDEADQLTGQVLFTGNTDGDAPNAHTVLDVGGVKYDAVLGTKGKAVDDAVAEQFDAWQKTGWRSKSDTKETVWVSKSKTTENWVVKEKGLKAAANQNGFSTAYRLTSHISNYAVPEKDVKD